MRFTKSIAAALAVTVGALSFTGAAEAGRRDRDRVIVRNNHYYHDNHRGNGLAAGVIGFGAGAILGSALAAPRYYSPAPVYVTPAPVYVAPVVVYEAWTPGWYSYCGSRYRSFNQQTGYYTGYDGGYHFCR